MGCWRARHFPKRKPGWRETAPVLQASVVAAVRDVFRDPPTEVSAQGWLDPGAEDATLWNGLPGVWRDAWNADWGNFEEELYRRIETRRQRVWQDLERRLAQARREFEARCADAAGGAVEAALPDRGEFATELENALRELAGGAELASVPTPEGPDGSVISWPERVSALLEDLDLAVDEARSRRLSRRASFLLEGEGEGDRGLAELLESLDLEAAADRVENFAEVDGEFREHWRDAIGELRALRERVIESLASSSGKQAQVLDSDFIRWSGPVRWDAVAKTFRLGTRSPELGVDDLAASEWLRWGGGEVSRDAKLLLLRHFPVRPDELQSVLDEAATSSPIELWVRALVAEDQQAEAADHEAESRVLGARFDELESALAEGQWDRAEGLFDELDRHHLRKRFPEHGERFALLETLRRSMADARGLDRIQQRLKTAFPHAKHEVQPSGTVTVEYDFSAREQGEDFDGPAKVVDAALRYGPDELTPAVLGGALGTSLPLAVDARAPFRLELELDVPYEGEDPHWTGFEIGGVSVLFFRPVPIRGEGPRPQLAVWTGSLSTQEMRTHTFDPDLVDEPEVGRVVAVGLHRGTVHQIELDARPGPEGSVILRLDGEEAFALELGRRQTLESSGRLVWKTGAALALRSLRFTGTLEGE